MPVSLTSANDGLGGRWEAEIIRTEGVVDPSSRVVYAVAEVVDPYGVLGQSEQEELRMGTFVRAEIQGRRAENVVVLPRSVLRPDATVLIATEERLLEVRPVSVARAEPREVFISDGIEEGELVVTTSMDAPIPGTRLAISGEEPEPAGLAGNGAETAVAAAGAEQ